jgi:hypothetical protein
MYSYRWLCQERAPDGSAEEMHAGGGKDQHVHRQGDDNPAVPGHHHHQLRSDDALCVQQADQLGP